MSACRSCGAPIIWVETERERKMPIDRMPTEDGNVEIIGMKAGVQIVKVHRNANTPALFAERRYTSHFVTCPNADEWRQR